MNKKISVIGSGGWGTAVALLLAKKENDVTLWSWQKEESDNLAKYHENKPFLPGVILPDNISFTSDLEQCADAELIVMATPSSAVSATAKNLSPMIKEGQTILNISKGLDPETRLRLSQIIRKHIPQADIAVMSGPSHAEEVSRGLPTTNVVAADNEKLAQKIQDIFMHDTFRVYTSSDMIGVEMGGTLKNVIAICAGITDGLGFGDNTKAALMTRGIAEIARLGVAMGAKPETFAGLSGIGDLIVTCTSMHSRNRRAGILIGKGKSCQEAVAEVKMVVEGVPTTKSGYYLAKEYGVDMPITAQAYEILFNGKKPKDAVMELMMRDKKHETF